MEAMACPLAIQGCTVDELKDKLCSQKGPKVQATQPDYVKFHDDKVGAYAGAAHHASEDQCRHLPAACACHYMSMPLQQSMQKHHDTACGPLHFEIFFLKGCIHTPFLRLGQMLC